MFLLGVLALAGFSPGESSAEPPGPQENVVLATKLYADMQSIATAVDIYHKQYKVIPSSTAELLSGAFLKSVPAMGKELGGGEYSIQKGYANMDGQGREDDTIYSGENVPEAVCVEFNKRYAQVPLNEGTIFDYRAAGNKYPGEVYGRQMKVYAIKWESDRNVCEVNWVLEYK